MSKDKHRSLGRRLALLREAEKHPIPLHCEGGIAVANPDLQRLAADGLVEIKRNPSTPKHMRRFGELQRQRLFDISAFVRRSFAFITDAGSAMLKRRA